MALEGCASCLKYIMIIWNFVILILGIAITGIGVWMLVDKDSGKFVDEFVEDDRFIISYSRVSDPAVFETLAYILIVFGAITVVIAFLGYCGAMRESQCLLGSCFALLFIIFGALVGIGIFLYIKKDEMDVDREKLRPVVGQMLRDAVENYYKDAASKNFMDAVQTKYECCGADKGAVDYAPILNLPGTCVTGMLTPCLDPYYEHVASTIGVKQFFSGKMTIAMAVALGVSGALILAMILTLVLCCAVRRSGSY